MGVELHADGFRTARCRTTGGGLSAVTVRRTAASLFRGCACGLPAGIEVGPLWGPHSGVVPFRRFAFGSPAVIESSPPMGAQASRSPSTRAGLPVRADAMMGRRAGLCAIWHSVNADTRVAPPFSVGNAEGRDFLVDPSLGFLFPSHGSAETSHGNFDPWALSGGKLGPICAI